MLSGYYRIHAHLWTPDNCRTAGTLFARLKDSYYRQQPEPAAK